MIFHVVYEYGYKFLSFCHNACIRQTDRQTDRQIGLGLSSTVCYITCSRTVKMTYIYIALVQLWVKINKI